MNDLTNSFKFNNNHSFDGFNKQENKKETEDKETVADETKDDIKDDSPAPLIINTKERKVLTDWLDAEYTSAFQYKKFNYSPYATSPVKNDNKNEIDINDPIVVYEFLKKYTNILYDYDCEKETEKIIIDTLEKELKEYFCKNSVDGLEEFMDSKFRELKEKYLVLTKETIPSDKINKLLFVKEL